MGYQYLIPEFCPTCNQLRKEDETYQSPKKMGEEDVVCFQITNMCTKCFLFVNGREFSDITKEYQQERNEFVTNTKTQ